MEDAQTNKKPRFAEIVPLPTDVFSMILRFAFSFDSLIKELNSIFATKSRKRIISLLSHLSLTAPRGADLPFLKSLVRQKVESGVVTKHQLQHFVEGFRRKKPELVTENWDLEEGQDFVLMLGSHNHSNFWVGLQACYRQSGYIRIVSGGQGDYTPIFCRVLKVTKNKICLTVHDVEVNDLNNDGNGCDLWGTQRICRLRNKEVCERDLFRSTMTFFAIKEGRRENPNEITLNWHVYG